MEATMKWPFDMLKKGAAPENGSRAAEATATDDLALIAHITPEMEIVDMVGSPHELPPVETAYVQGVLDGRKSLPTEHFEAYIKHTLDESGVDTILELRQSQYEEKLKKAEHALALERSLARKEEDLAAADVKLRETAEEKHRIETQHEADEKRRRDLKKGSLAMAIVFLVAAVLFIVGEISVAVTIVADGYEMDGLKAYLFAFGLAAIAVLLKPAYDRLVEEPYWEGRRTSFRWTILATGGIAVTTVLALAIFRNEAFLIGQLIETAPLDRAMELRQELGENLFGQIGLIGAAVTFALGGAVCMSIGFAHLGEVRVRQGAKKRLATLIKLHDALRARVTELRGDIAEARAELRRIDLDDVLTELGMENAVREELAHTAIEHRIARIQSIYNDGYETGKTDPEPVRVAPQVGVTPTSTKAPGGFRKRPYKRLRDHIRNAALDGMEI
jgi:hypothetical protein